jgi:hypothetical protein
MCALLVAALSGCDKPHSLSLVRVHVLEDRSIQVENRRYSSIPEARAAIKQIEDNQPNARFTLSVTNLSEQQGMEFVRQLSDGDGKMSLVGFLAEPKAMKN